MARQKLGQHFLGSAKVLERIALAACGERTPLVVEIGPGKGALTRRLLAHADKVVAIELDRELARHLQEVFVDEPRLSVIEANALDVDWPAWGASVLAGNLPYYVATAIISKYVRKPGAIASGVFLIQKEVAERITAHPRTREYGYFSVECQFLATVKYLFTVPPGAFSPPPKVDSAVIRLTPREAPAMDADAFLRFVSACFRQKRKTLRNNLSGMFSGEVLGQRPEIGLRAEQLSADELLLLYRGLAGYGNRPQIPDPEGSPAGHHD